MTSQTNGTTTMVQGRIVWGIGKSLFAGEQKTDYNTKQPVLDTTGNPVMNYGFGLAVPMVDPATGQNTQEFLNLWQTLHAEAYTLYPDGNLPPNFAMKYKNGDSDIDQNGKPYADREGYKGHLVLSCTTQIPIKWFKFEGGNNILVNEGIKVGDYVEVQLNIKAHPKKNQGNPGLYLNPSCVRLIQPGKEIVNVPSGDQIFGQAAPTYNGQVEAPTTSAMPNMPQTAPAPAPSQAAPVHNPAPAPGQPAPAPAHHGVLPQHLQPTQPAPAPAPNVTHTHAAPMPPNQAANTHTAPTPPAPGA